MALHAAGITVFSVGVSQGVDKTELAALSSQPQQENINWFTSTDFNALSNVVDKLTTQTCMAVSKC